MLLKRLLINFSYSYQMFTKLSRRCSVINFSNNVNNRVSSFNLVNSRYKTNIVSSNLTFESVSSETLESLTEYFETLIENASNLSHADISFSNGVLTVSLGNSYGTYVINRQSPNSQIWLSSPISGPKRYDFKDGSWVYKHDGHTLHYLLQKEFSDIVSGKVDFSKCTYSKL